MPFKARNGSIRAGLPLLDWLQVVTGCSTDWDYGNCTKVQSPKMCSYLYIRVFFGDLKIVPLRYQKQRFLPLKK